MKKKIGDLTLRELKNICKKHGVCNKKCPFYNDTNESYRSVCYITNRPPSRYVNKKEVEVQE